MIFNITFKNSSVAFKEQEFIINDKGIHLVSGINGVGKTTIIKRIVYNESKSKSHKIIPKDVFAYISQDTPNLDLSIEKYIFRYNNQELDIEFLYKLLEMFKLSGINLKTKTNHLSGGELTKINIISGLIKKNRIIILDEPTNNLDDESVDTLIEVIEELAITRSVVIVSHDVRLKFNKVYNIVIKKGIIDNEFSKNTITDIKTYKSKIKFPIFKLLKRFMLSIPFLSNILFLLGIVLLIFSINNSLFMNFFSTEEMPPDNGYVVTYNVDYTYGDLNNRYATYVKIDEKIDESNYSHMIKFDNIPEIAELYDTYNIYYSNDDYLDQVQMKYYTDSLIDDINIISMPHEILENYHQLIPFNLNLKNIISGRLPNDNSDEVVLSKQMIETYYNHLDQDNAIGEQIIYQEHSYKIVGIGYYDLMIISYEHNHQFGFTQYNETNFQLIKDEIINYKSTYGFIFPNSPNNIVIKTSKDDEKTLLESLLIDYPANNYYSYNFAYYYQQSINKPLLKNMFIGNLVFSFIFSVTMFMINKKQYVVDKHTCNVYNDYYLRKNGTEYIILTTKFLMTILVFAFIMYLTHYHTIFSEIQTMMLINLLIMIVPQYLLIWFKK